MTTPIGNNYNAYLAAQSYPPAEIKQPKGGMGEQNGAQGVNPFAGVATQPVQQRGAAGGEAYEGQAMVSSIAHSKAAMAKVGLGGNPHPTETLGNKLMVSEYDLAY